MTGFLSDPKVMLAVHGWAAVLWVVLALGTTVAALFFPDHPFLLAWVIFMSGYANAAAHWAARQGAEAEADGGTTPD